MPVSEVYLMDCVEYMKTIPDQYFDLAITDPPYGIDINMNMGRKKGQKAAHKKKNWDNAIPGAEYFSELKRVSKNQIVWGGNYFTDHLGPTKSWIFWDKLVPDGVSFADGELAWTSFDKTLVKMTVRYTGFQGSEGKIHPTQKPVKLYQKLLNKYAMPGDKILDTHLGSGSHRIAAYDLGFDFYACELDEEYYAGQQTRFEAETAQNSIFNFLKTT